MALTRRAMEGISISSLTQLASGTILAATHGVGVARSTDDGHTWEWSNKGLVQYDLWAARSGIVHGRDVALVGSMPSALMLSDDDGVSWQNLTGLHEVSSFAQWYFPPPPRLGHIKEINIFRDRIYVGIEIGALLVSDDCGKTFKDLVIDPDPKECDVHRVLINPLDLNKMHAAVGLVGSMRSVDGGTTWTRDPIMPGLEYPDAFVLHPDQPRHTLSLRRPRLAHQLVSAQSCRRLHRAQQERRPNVGAPAGRLARWTALPVQRDLGSVGFDFVDEEHAPFDRGATDMILLGARAALPLQRSVTPSTACRRSPRATNPEAFISSTKA